LKIYRRSPNLITRDRAALRQCIDALLAVDSVDPNHGRLPREFDRSDNGIQLRGIEIALELLARFPFLNKNERPELIDIGEETCRETPWRHPRRPENRSKCAQQCCSYSVGRCDLQRKYDQDLVLSVASALSCRRGKKRANRKAISISPQMLAKSEPYAVAFHAFTIAPCAQAPKCRSFSEISESTACPLSEVPARLDNLV